MDQYFVATLFEWSYFFVIVGLIHYFIRTSPGKSNKGLLRHWLLFGFVVNFYGLSWLYTAYPLPWMEKGVTQLVGIFLLHSIISLGASLPYPLISYSFNTRIKDIYVPFFFASLVTIAEIGRALIISVLYYGDNTTIGLHFTAGTIGNALSVTPFIEFAYFGGTFALTFILSYLVYAFHSKKHFNQYKYHALAIVILLLCIHIFLPAATVQKKTTVGIITTNFDLPQNLDTYNDTLKKQGKLLHTMTLSLANASPTFIVYPEDTRYSSSIRPEDKTDLLINFKKTLFIDGDVVPAKNSVSNVSLFYDPKRIMPLARGKEFLMPFSEYIPYFFRPLFGLFIAKDQLNTYSEQHTYTPLYSNKTVSFNGVRIGTLICSEILSFATIAKLSNEKPSIVFFQSHLNVFHNNPWFIMHLMSFSKVAAAQMRVTIISSANNAPSLIVSPSGKLIRFIDTGFSTSTYRFR